MTNAIKNNNNRFDSFISAAILGQKLKGLKHFARISTKLHGRSKQQTLYRASFNKILVYGAINSFYGLLFAAEDKRLVI